VLLFHCNSGVKQRLKCNTGKVCNCLIQFLLTAVLSIEERVFLVEYVFREGNRYTDLVLEQFAEKFQETPVPHRNAVHRDRPRTLNELKTLRVVPASFCTKTAKFVWSTLWCWP
jgi:Cdc6-like AAA superfamily ATPase